MDPPMPAMKDDKVMNTLSPMLQASPSGTLSSKLGCVISPTGHAAGGAGLVSARVCPQKLPYKFHAVRASP